MPAYQIRPFNPTDAEYEAVVALQNLVHMMSPIFRPFKLTEAEEVNWMDILVKQSPVYELTRHLVMAETAVTPTSLSLTDQSDRGKLLVKGQAAEAVLSAVFPLPTLAVNQGAMIAEGAVYRLRPDLFLLNTAVDGETAVQTQLNETIQTQGVFVTVTDGTHGRFQFQLRGDKSPDLLSRVCGLDFHDSQFPNLTAKQSSVAKTAQIIIRQDAGQDRAYFLIGPRSLAVYVWQTLRQAGQDWFNLED